MKLRCILFRTTTIVLAILVFASAADTEHVSEEAQQQESTEERRQQPVSETPIKLVHVLNPGEREYLSPNLIGVQNIAMTYLPLTMNFINIIDAFREIVNGVRYEIMLNAVDTKANNGADIICRLVILEKPWLRTEWGDKVRELLYSNCTNTADADNRDIATTKYQSSNPFNSIVRNELNAEDMQKLESEIMTDRQPERQDKTAAATTTAKIDIETISSAATNTDDEMNTETKELNENEKKLLDDIFAMGALNFEKSLQHNDNNNDNSERINDDIEVDYDREQQQPMMTLAGTEVADENSEQLESGHARVKRNSDPIVGGAMQLQKNDAELRLQETLNKIATGDGAPIYRIGKIHSATTQVVSGTLTKIDADLIDKREKEVRCNIEIWSQPWLPDGNEVTIKCPGKKTLLRRHSRSLEYTEKKTHKKHPHHVYDKSVHLFNKFQIKYNKRYANTAERQMRMRIFRQNIKTIEELNRNEMGSAKYGITEFADLTSAEYKQRTGLWQRAANGRSKNALAQIPDIALPKEFDWREKGVISKVKNQGSCGSCWAFSVTGNIEGLHAIKTGQLEEYSEQELLDCDTIDSACNGGLPDNAYEAIQKIGGLELESAYPYEARKRQCHFNTSLSHVQVKGGIDLPKNETAMAQWLIANGPISIGINANAMQFYRGGVSHPWHHLCAHSSLDHGVLIVGYGVSDYPMFKKTMPYWIVKNSWGTKWGEQGYYRVYRGDNTCGVSEMATSAVLA